MPIKEKDNTFRLCERCGNIISGVVCEICKLKVGEEPELIIEHAPPDATQTSHLEVSWLCRECFVNGVTWLRVVTTGYNYNCPKCGNETALNYAGRIESIW